jgi:hypothetical protein
VVSLEVVTNPVELEMVVQTIELEMVAVQGLPGRDGISSFNPPIYLTAINGQTQFALPEQLLAPSSARLFINGGQYTYGRSWNYDNSTTTLTWVNSAFSLSNTDEIVLYK